MVNSKTTFGQSLKKYIRNYKPEFVLAPEKYLIMKGLVSKAGAPDFLGIGMAKAGTTWLDRNLRCHPELYLPHRKELHYFDRYYSLPFSYYTRAFRTSGGRIKGEITPEYGILEQSKIRFIHAAMPDVKLILLLRNLENRMWSNFLMHVKRGLYRADSKTDFYAFFAHQKCLEIDNPVSILQKWTCYFPLSRIFIGRYEHIRNSPQALLNGVFEHLGASCVSEWEAYPLSEKVNQGINIPMPGEYAEMLSNHYLPVYEQLSERFGFQLNESINDTKRK